MRAGALALLAAAGLLGALSRAEAHPGPLDEYGGHFDEKTGIYHYHHPKWDVTARTKEYLGWVTVGKVGELSGVVSAVERPDAIWVQVPYRPAYQTLVPYLSAPNRKDEQAAVRVWFQYVSPEVSAEAQDKAYYEWFTKKLIYELERKLKGKPVTVQFHLVPVAGRMKGMVMLGEENINLWLVLNGWSYYMLDREGNPHEKSFTDAEAIARKEKAGLWGR